MRKKVLTLIVVGVCSLGLIGCGKRKDINVEPSTATTGVSQSGIQSELVKFVSEDLARLNVKRQQAVEIYNEYFASNTKDADSTDWVKKLTDEAIPKYDEYISDLKALKYDSKEVNDLRDKYVRSAELQRDAINQIVNSITNNDDSYVEKAKKDIEDSKVALKEYEDSLKLLCQQNQITINGSFQMDNFTASPSDAK
jgi:vacuolar-type H+-ATPase subunit I/STV1